MLCILVTRSGRVRKKPAKFVETLAEEEDMKPEIEKLQSPPIIEMIPIQNPITTPVIAKQPVLATPVQMKPDPETEDDEEFGKAARSSRVCTAFDTNFRVRMKI